MPHPISTQPNSTFPTHTLTAGVVTAFAAFCVNVSVENLSGFKFWATLSLIGRGHILLSFIVYVAINFLLVASAVLVTVRVGPAAAGSGIAEVKVCVAG